MGKIIDIDKAQEALDRAARNARSGPADVRAGRFVLRDARRGEDKRSAQKGDEDTLRDKK